MKARSETSGSQRQFEWISWKVLLLEYGKALEVHLLCNGKSLYICEKVLRISVEF